MVKAEKRVVSLKANGFSASSRDTPHLCTPLGVQCARDSEGEGGGGGPRQWPGGFAAVARGFAAVAHAKPEIRYNTLGPLTWEVYAYGRRGMYLRSVVCVRSSVSCVCVLGGFAVAVLSVPFGTPNATRYRADRRPHGTFGSAGRLCRRKNELVPQFLL
jgi:hypothetical protein